MALSTVLRRGASRSVHMSACENHALLQNLGHHFVALGKDSLQIPRHKQHKILPRDQLSGHLPKMLPVWNYTTFLS